MTLVGKHLMKLVKLGVRNDIGIDYRVYRADDLTNTLLNSGLNLRCSSASQDDEDELLIRENTQGFERSR